MGKLLSHEQLSATLAMSECTDGWWLYDSTRGMNLAMRAKSRDEAFLTLAAYYQDRLARVETEHRALTAKVELFVSQFVQDDNDIEV